MKVFYVLSWGDDEKEFETLEQAEVYYLDACPDVDANIYKYINLAEGGTEEVGLVMRFRRYYE